MQQPGNKLLPTMINFHQTYQLMKSYLSKKRFSYVYEECIKYYNKSQAFFSNHEVLMLVRLVFYVLKKKMITKFVGKAKSNWSVEQVHQIYSVMTNVYLSWQGVLLVQMHAQDTTFFEMIHRNNQFRKNRQSIIKTKRPQNVIFEAKKDMVVGKKVNIQASVYLFFKQCLQMVVNTLTVMASCIDNGKVQRMMSILKMSDAIMSQFEQHHFPVEKIQFYILKCQIIQYINDYSQTCVHLPIKYSFPTGFFQLIYKNIYAWKQAKTCHYVQLLFKMIIVSMKNELLSVEEAFVLGNQIKLLVLTIKHKEIEMTGRRSSARGRRGGLNVKVGMNVQPQQQQMNNGKRGANQNNNNSYQNQKQSSQKNQPSSQSSKWKAKCFNTLKAIMTELQNYIHTRKQLAHILRAYLQPVYSMYKQNPTHQNDELIDQIPVLIDRDQKKNRNKRSSAGKRDEGNGIAQRKEMTTTDAFRREGHHDDEHGHEGLAGHAQAVKKKDNKIILKNILNIKHRKVLSLNNNTKGNQSSRDWKGMNKSQSTQANTTLNNNNNAQSQQNEQQSSSPSKPKFPFSQLISTIMTASFSQLKALQPCTKQPLNLLQQSESDSDNQLEYEFEMKRRTTIQDLNNRFYKHSNPNYMDKEEKDEETQGNDDSWDGVEDEDEDRDEIDGGFGKKKISDDLEFQEIRLLDDVIKQKIFGYLDLELVDAMKQQGPSNDKTKTPTTQTSKINLTPSSPNSNNKSPQDMPLITSYSNVVKLTETLRSQVQDLNRRRKLIIDKLKYKTYSLKTCQKYSPTQENEHNLISSSLKDLENIYNTKSNLTQKAEKCVSLYRKLLKIDQIEQKMKSSVFDRAVKKYGKIYRKYNEELSMIGEQDEDEDLTHRRAEEVPILEYIVKNRPISLLEQTLKRKELQAKFQSSTRKEILTEEKKQIALRDTFDNLRANISKTQFNESNSLTKNFSLKVPTFQ